MTDLLTLTQWLSPAFPLGSFAYSHGLEVAISKGEVKDADGLQDWLSDTLRFGAGRMDAILLALTHRGGSVDDLAATARALAPTRERWEEAQAQGRAFAQTVSAIDTPVPEVAFPVALGFAARRLSLGTGDVAALYLHSFASNLVSAGVRFIPLGQTAGQAVLSALHPTIQTIAHHASDATLDDLTSATMRGDLVSAGHETLEVRIFRT